MPIIQIWFENFDIKKDVLLTSSQKEREREREGETFWEETV